MTAEEKEKSFTSSRRTSGRWRCAARVPKRRATWRGRFGAAATPDAEALRQTIDESERVLADLGQVEIAIAELKASLW